MKKFLAIFLVLVMVLSISLVACNKKTEKGDDTDDDDDWGNGGVTTSDTTNESDSTPSGGDDTTADGPSHSGGTVWYDKNDTIYVAHDTYLRTEPLDSAKSGILVKLGDALTRKASSNGVWDKIDYDGNTYYIYTYLTVTNKSLVTFDMFDEPIVTSMINEKKDGEGYSTYNLRYSPLYDETGNLDNLGVSGVTKQMTSNGELKILGVSQSQTWVCVEYNGKDASGKDVSGVFYCRPAHLDYFQEPEDTTGQGGIKPV